MSTNNPTLTVLDKMIAVQPVISLISGKVKLNEEDLPLKDGKSVPAEICNLGSKRVLDPKELKIFTALKAKAVSYLDKHCLRFLNGGWLCPEDLAGEVIKMLDTIRQEFLVAKDRFLTNYDKLIQDWVEQNKSYKEILEGYTLGKNYVAKNLSFEYFLYNISTSSPNSNVAPVIQNLGQQLIDEIVKEACEIRKSTFTDRDSLCRKSLRPIKGLAEKLHDLAFVNPDASVIEGVINGLVDRIPARGSLDGILSVGIYSLVDTLCDKQKLLQVVEKAKSSNSSNVIDALFVQHEQVTEQSAQQEQASIEILTPNEPVRVAASEPTPSSYVTNCGLW